MTASNSGDSCYCYCRLLGGRTLHFLDLCLSSFIGATSSEGEGDEEWVVRECFTKATHKSASSEAVERNLVRTQPLSQSPNFERTLGTVGRGWGASKTHRYAITLRPIYFSFVFPLSHGGTHTRTNITSEEKEREREKAEQSRWGKCWSGCRRTAHEIKAAASQHAPE